MKQPFVRRGDTIRVRLPEDAREMLAALPDLLAAAGDAGGRLDYRVHPADPAAEARYRDLVGDSLDSLRVDDRALMAANVAATTIGLDEAESWMRVIGEARLALAARLGISEDGWETASDPSSDPELALLHYLGFLQDRLVAIL